VPQEVSIWRGETLWKCQDSTELISWTGVWTRGWGTVRPSQEESYTTSEGEEAEEAEEEEEETATCINASWILSTLLCRS
jgi:GH24 family phage-related lysozyme (muramidase)